MTIQLPTLTALRYAVPLREGGSLPAVVDTAEDGYYVVKFRGAGQGPKSLVAELIVGLLAKALELPVPDLALVELDASFGRTEKDPEIQDILKASRGINMGLRYLDGAFNYEPGAAADLVDAELAANVVWFDSLVTNIDRTPRNANMMVWQRRPWLIDHGAALYFHHRWSSVSPESMRKPFSHVTKHVLLPIASDIEQADARLVPRLSRDVLREVLDVVPDTLLFEDDATRDQDFSSAQEAREAYVDALSARLQAPRAFVAAAEQARRELGTTR